MRSTRNRNWARWIPILRAAISTACWVKTSVSREKPPAANLYLRVRVGDIVILKLNGPPAE